MLKLLKIKSSTSTFPLQASAFVLLIVLFSSIGFTFLLGHESGHTALEVNLAGRQRMLTERMSLLAYQLVAARNLGLSETDFKKDLTKAITLFDETHKAFKEGSDGQDAFNPSLKINANTRVECIALLQQVDEIWHNYRRLLESLLNNPLIKQIPPELIQQLKQLETHQLNLANRFTETTQQYNEAQFRHLNLIRIVQFLVVSGLACLSFYLFNVRWASMQKLNIEQQNLINLLNTCMDKANDVIMVTEAEPFDLPGPRIIYVNEAFTQVTGYSAEEAIGNTPRMLQGVNSSKEVSETIHKALRRWQTVRAEVLNYKKNGEEFWAELNITPIANEKGWFTHWLSVQRDITERKRFEEQVDQLSQRYKNILDNIPALIGYWDKNQCNVFSYLAYTDWFGQDLTPAIGSHLRELLGDETYQYNLPYIEGVLRGEKQRFERILPYTKGNQIRQTITEYIPDKYHGEVNGFYVMVIDISDLRLAEASKMANEEKLSALFNLCPLGIARTDMAGRFVEFNEAFRMISGHSEEQLKNIDYWQLTPPGYEVQEAEQIDSLKRTGYFGPYEKEYRRADGQLVPVLLNGLKVTGEDGLEYIWAIAEDITKRKQVELQLLKAKQAAEALAESKSQFLANMSHEIRTPMSAILGLSELLLNQNVSDQVRDYLNKINESSTSLLGILNDILDFSKLEAGKFSIEQMPFNLNQLINNLYNLFAHAAEKKNIQFKIKIQEGTPCELLGDELRIQQVLSNLLSNAIKFTQQGSVQLSIVLLAVDEGRARLKFSVNDSGIGISEQDLSKLFQAFSQADSSNTRRFGGTGLGLVISQKLLNVMGSDCHVISVPNQGSSFSFELSLERSDTSVATPSSSHDATQEGSLSAQLTHGGRSLAGSRVLVVEDNPINQLVVKEFLVLSGIQVDIANHGKEALNRLELNQYDAILMDVHMPEMGGVEATQHIRQQSQYKHLPIIALSAGVTQEERTHILECGMNAFVAKPIVPNILLATLEEWIGRYH